MYYQTTIQYQNTIQWCLENIEILLLNNSLPEVIHSLKLTQFRLIHMKCVAFFVKVMFCLGWEKMANLLPLPNAHFYFSYAHPQVTITLTKNACTGVLLKDPCLSGPVSFYVMGLNQGGKRLQLRCTRCENATELCVLK